MAAGVPNPPIYFLVIIPLLVIELKATPNGNPSDDFCWRQKSSSLNGVQYNTTSRPIIIHLQIYIALPENLINRATLEYVPGLTHILLSITYNQFFFFILIKQRTLPRKEIINSDIKLNSQHCPRRKSWAVLAV